MSSWTAKQLSDLRRVAEAGGYAAAFADPQRRKRASARLRRLEEGLGDLHKPRRDRINVLTRGGHELTPAGEALLELAYDFIDADDRIRSWLSGNIPGPMVRVGGYPAHLRLINAARRTVASAKIEITARLIDASRSARGLGLAREIVSNRLDVAILPARITAQFDGLASRELYSWHLSAVVGPHHRWHGSQEAIPVGDLLDEHLVLSPDGHASRRQLERAVDSIIEPAFESASTDAVIEMALEGNMVAVVPSDAIPLRWIRAGGGTLGTILPVVDEGRSIIEASYVVAFERQDTRSEIAKAVDSLVTAARITPTS